MVADTPPHNRPLTVRASIALQATVLSSALACGCSFDTTGNAFGRDTGGFPDCDDRASTECDGETTPDSDGDTVPDSQDSDPSNPHVCGDRDGDQCDDCSSGRFDLYNDGPNQDGDLLCDLGESCTGSTRLVASMANGELVYSDDQGASWKRSPEGLAPQPIADVAYGLGRFVAVGKGGMILVSSDGARWSPAATKLKQTEDDTDPSSLAVDFHTVLHAENGWWAVAGEEGTIGLSRDNGATWIIERGALGDKVKLTDLAYDLDSRRWMVLEAKARVVHSAEIGETLDWTKHGSGKRPLASMSSRDGVWLAASTAGQTSISDNQGKQWTESLQLERDWKGVLTTTSQNAFLLAMSGEADSEGPQPGLYLSPDGLSWDKVVSLPDLKLSSMAYDCSDGRLYYGASDGSAFSYPLGDFAIASASAGSSAITGLAANADGAVTATVFVDQKASCEDDSWTPRRSGVDVRLHRIDLQPGAEKRPALFGQESADDNVVRIQARLRINAGGEYRFRMTLGSEDAARLVLDGEEVIDGCQKSGKAVATALSAGIHKLELQWNDSGGDDRLTLAYAGPDTGSNYVTVPARAFIP